MKNNTKYILLIISVTIVIILVFLLLENFWIAFLINQVLIFITLFFYLKTVKQKNKNLKKIKIFLGSVLLQFAIGYGTNITYNQLFPGNERTILSNTKKSLKNTEEILVKLDDKGLEKFKIEIRKYELNSADINSLEYLINRLEELNDNTPKIESYIKQEYLESSDLILQLKGLVLLSYSSKKEVYIPLLKNKIKQTCLFLSKTENDYRPDMLSLLQIFRNFSKWKDEDSFTLAREILDSFNFEFKNPYNRLFLLKIAMSVNCNKQKALALNDVDLLILILQENNKYLAKRQYETLNDLVAFSPQTFWCVSIKEIKKMNCDINDEISATLALKLRSYAEMAGENNEKLEENIFGHLDEKFPNVNTAQKQLNTACSVFRQLEEKNIDNINFWLTNSLIIQKEKLKNKILNNSL
jgi:hypothetical protein